MIRACIVFAIFYFTTVLYSCQKEFSADNPHSRASENTSREPLNATLQGNITDEYFKPAANVTVRTNFETTRTDTGGNFRIINASLDKNASLVIAEAPGYFKAYRVFQATAGANYISIKLVRKVLAGTIIAGDGGDVTVTGQAKISLQPGGVINASGSKYSGTVNVFASYIDPSSPDIGKIVPGSFMADDKNGKRVVLRSFGMLAVELESPGGEKLQIAPGSSSVITVPIPATDVMAAAAAIPLWYIDPATGMWREEGTATKVGSNYVGEVKHFSFWNCDIGSAAIKLSLTLKSSKGLPITFAQVRVKSTQNGIAQGYTDSLGHVSGLVPSNEDLVLDVFDECYNSIFTKNVGTYTENIDLGDLTVQDVSSSIVTIQGKISGCMNNAVTEGYAVIYLDNSVYYAAVNDNGEFATTFVKCPGSSPNCKILGVDISSQQQGNVTEFQIVYPVTNANVPACGIASLQFFSYTLDGVNYGISSAAQDSLYAFTNPDANDFITYLGGSHFSRYISIRFNHKMETGTYPVNYLSVNGSNSLIRPFNVNLTSYPQSPGEFYEGNFAGQFLDSISIATVHNISGSFKVRR